MLQIARAADVPRIGNGETTALVQPAKFSTLVFDRWHLSLWRKAGALKSEKPTFYSRSHHAVIRVYDEAGNVIDTHERAGDFKEP
jgi:hypothetical protein